jgi:hypothetical protein
MELNNRVTIVSGFVSNANNRDMHKTGMYARNGKLLLKSTTPKIIFLDEEMFSQINEQDYDPENTRIILYSREQMYYMKYVDKINYYPTLDNPLKNTKLFLLTMWNKTEYMKEAIQINPFNTEYYVWIDFGIRYVCKERTDQEFIEKLNNIRQPVLNNNIRIGGIWNTNHNYSHELIIYPLWYFAGGVFGGSRNALLVFSEEMRKATDELVTKYKVGTWELNIWYVIYKFIPELFDIYPCSHDETLIDGYSTEKPLAEFIKLVF